MKPGKKIETLVALIQDTLKESDNTVIYSNLKIPNISGQKREFDVLIESTINSFKIKIAIECKDYKRKVGAEKIEAFNSKCQRIPEINKKIFVSTNGYQKDAVNAANDFGIELYDFKKISPNTILSWFPISQIADKFEVLLPVSIQLIGSKEEIEKISLPISFNVQFYDNREPIEISKLLLDILREHRNEYQASLLEAYLQSKAINNLKHSFPFIINCKGIYLTFQEKEYSIVKIETKIFAWFEEIPIEVIESRDFKNETNSLDIKTLSLDFKNAGKTDLIFSSRKTLNIFHTKADGTTYKLKPLLKYDPKTNKTTKL
jgi:hypothetical protein